LNYFFDGFEAGLERRGAAVVGRREEQKHGRQRQKQPQIPFGDDNKNGNGKGNRSATAMQDGSRLRAKAHISKSRYGAPDSTLGPESGETASG
jgi:hypothetical protein